MNKLKQLREEFGLSLRDIEKVIPHDKSSFSNMERGIRGLGKKNIKRFTEFFQVSEGYLLGYTDKGVYVTVYNEKDDTKKQIEIDEKMLAALQEDESVYYQDNIRMCNQEDMMIALNVENHPKNAFSGGFGVKVTPNPVTQSIELKTTLSIEKSEDYIEHVLAILGYMDFFNDNTMSALREFISSYFKRSMPPEVVETKISLLERLAIMKPAEIYRLLSFIIEFMISDEEYKKRTQWF